MTVEEQFQLSSIDDKYQYLFTVFTATYNRGYTLHRVYDSLKAQTYRNFEWLVIDDGSTENIREIVEKWQQENLFPIRYLYKENGGKHTAFNRGVQEAKGELFLNLDSDDSCVPEALEKFKYHWDSIPVEQKDKFSAVTCLCQDQHGNLVGDRFPFDVIDSDSLEIYYRYQVTGEKWGFHRTEVLKEFPFPEEIKKTYMPESLVWNRISRKYKTRYVNEILRTFWIEEISQGHGGNPGRNSVGRRLAHLAVLNEEIDWLTVNPWLFVRSAINYSRNCFHLGIWPWKQWQALDTTAGKILWAIALPWGYLAYTLGMIGILKG
jgi:glycosyltransferase involved in cell wall biosynthesis